MRKTALAGLFLCTLIFVAHGPKVGAEASDPIKFERPSQKANELAIKELAEQKEEEDKVLETVLHLVQPGETLIEIAKTYDTTWQRLFDKNTDVIDPNVIAEGEELIIPFEDEELEPRPLPEPQTPVQPAAKTSAAQQDNRSAPTGTYNRGSSSGNLYTRGYCTWYAKNRRPDLPNNLGNADTWVSRARAQGIPTGLSPRVGAIGQQGMHVVYVEKVNGDGTVTISEMNFRGWNVISSRTVSASNFAYIY